MVYRSQPQSHRALEPQCHMTCMRLSRGSGACRSSRRGGARGFDGVCGHCWAGPGDHILPTSSLPLRAKLSVHNTMSWQRVPSAVLSQQQRTLPPLSAPPAN